MTYSLPRNLWAGALAVILLLSAAAVGRADEILVGNLPIRNIRITSIADGTVEYIAAGSRRIVELSRVSSIDISRYPAYATAVKQIADKPADAVRDLQQLLGQVREDYLKPLIRLRLSQALDGADRFESAVEQWLEAIQADGSDFFLRRAPGNIPEDEATRQAAAKLVQRAVDRARPGTDSRTTLEALLGKINAGPAADAPDPADGNGQTAADGTDGGGQDNDAPDPGVDVQRMSTIQKAIRDGDIDGAIARAHELIERSTAQGSMRLVPDLYFQIAQAQVAGNRPRDAALSYLRIAIHFPDHDLTVPALEKAGEQLLAADRSAAAAKVWERAIELTEDAATQARLRQAISRLPQP